MGFTTCLQRVSSLSLAASVVACGLQRAQSLDYPPPPKAASQEELDAECPIELAAFAFHIAPMLRARCSVACHEPGGSGAASLTISGDAQRDNAALKRAEDGKAEGIFRKAAGGIPHAGGAAAEPRDLQRLQRWAGAAALCQLDSEARVD